MTYTAPVSDMRFTLEHIVGFGRLSSTPLYADATPETAAQILEEAGKFAAEVLAPLNRDGDQAGAERLPDGRVIHPDGWRDAYQQFVANGWNSVAGPTEAGGMGLPISLSMAVFEMVSSANMSFGLCPLLTFGAIHALELHGTPAQKATYLPKLVSGEWSGTMNLTEPQAGSDVGALTTKAVPNGDGSYAISGQKIYITFGEHELSDNIIHLVLARLPDAPIGTRGISLFLVPKRFVNDDGSLGEANAVRCLKIEEKLGIHASPTCVMAYEDATGWLIGKENGGMRAMFTMMNDARLAVGVQGVGVIEAAFQQALAYAQDRRQGKPVGKQHDQKDMIPIVEHPDVRRMLLDMRAHAEAARAITLDCAVALDLAKAVTDEAERTAARHRVELLTPIAKAWPTDKGVEMASVGVQVHGGMGFIEETGAAQHLRDARILPIYEGTNGIQAIDLVTRKLPMADGDVVRAYLSEVQETAEACRRSNAPDLVAIADQLAAGHAALMEVSEHLLRKLAAGEVQDALAGASPYLALFGAVAGGHYLARGALAAHGQAGGEAAAVAERRIAIARHFAETTVAAGAGLKTAAMRGAGSLMAVSPEALAS